MLKPAKRPVFNAVIFGAYPPKRTASAAKRKDLAYMERAFGFLHLHGAQNYQELPPHVVVMQFSAAFSAENQVMVMTGEPVIQALAAFNADRHATLFISLPPQCDE